MDEQVTAIRVRYSETDQQGRVYHAHFFAYFEVARTEWLRSHGIRYRDLETQGLYLVVVEASCRYRAPAAYDDVLHVAARLADISHVRLIFDYVVTRAGEGQVLAEGRTALACLDSRGRPRRLPAGVGGPLKPA
jgi:acyl-CoA thioester hydrolase